MPFRLRHLASAFVVALVAQSALAQDFDPNGRHHHHPNPNPNGGHPNPNGGHPNPNGGHPAGTQSPQVLIDRYTKVVLSQPGSPFPLQRLAQLYREKDGSLKNLIADFEQRAGAAGATQYAAVVRELSALIKKYSDGKTDSGAQ